MITASRRVAGLLACTLLLGGCGGGGTSSPAAHATLPTTVATAAPSGAPLATAKLTIAFPASFHTAKAGSSAHTANAAQRKPAYVNPNSSNIIDIFVDGVDETPGMAVSNTSDGTQTVTLNIYSTSAHQIVAVETEDGLSVAQVLAIGETDVPASSFTPGDVTAIGLTMLMNATGIGITNDPTNGSDAVFGTASNSSIAYQDTVCGGIPGTGSDLYLFGTDMEGGFTENGFVPNPGAGVPIPSLSSAVNSAGTSPPSDSLVFSGGINTYFQINYNASSGGMTLTTQLTNPAGAVAQSAFGSNNFYPGIAALYYSNGNPGPLYDVIYQINAYPVVIQFAVRPYVQGCG